MTTVDTRRLNEAIATEYLEDMLARAEAGDVYAARDALMSIGHYLSSKNLHPDTGEPLPVPEFLRDYLSNAFYRMCNGMNADRALNLKRSGRKTWRHKDKRLAAYLVYQAVHEHDQPVLKAAIEAAAFINEEALKGELTGQWGGFQGKKVNSDSLKDWYYELKPELKAMYEASTVKSEG